MTTFLNLNLSDRLLGIIKDMGYNEPTPIQTLSIPKIIKGLDVLGVAETGSGKTAAFSLPLIEKQIQDKRKKMAVLVLEPTRELAVQTAKMIGEYGKFFPIYRRRANQRYYKRRNAFAIPFHSSHSRRDVRSSFKRSENGRRCKLFNS